MFWYFTNFSFHHKWNETWLLVKNMVLKGCLAHCQATEVQEISKHPRIIILIKSTPINPPTRTNPPPPQQRASHTPIPARNAPNGRKQDDPIPPATPTKSTAPQSPPQIPAPPATQPQRKMGESLKRGLVFCIKPLDSVEVSIPGVGFVKVRVGIL